MKIGTYEVLAEIGRGAVGVVLRARSPEGREVALKLLRRPGQDSLARFRRERRLLAALGEREGFVPLLDAGDAREGPYLVMPLLEGGTLRDRLRRGPLAIEEAVSLLLSLARALGRAHERGIVHRDVKPENVLFTKEGVPLVADLGLAKHFVQAAPGEVASLSLSKTGDFRGTAGYMAPEQLVNAKDAGPRADVFSLGAILYECLSGAPVFSGDTTVEVMVKVEACSFDPLSTFRPETPAWLARVVERALSKDPGARPANGAQLASCLEKRERAGGKRALVLVPIVLVAAAAAAFVLFFEERRDEERTPPSTASTPPAAAVSSLAPPASEPTTAFGFVQRAGLHFEKRRLDAAIADCTRAIDLEPENALPWSFRANAKVFKGDALGALADADRAIQLDARLSGAWANRASAHYLRGELDLARADAARAIELDPRLPGPYGTRCLVFLQMGETAAALADANREIELDPRNADAWSRRGDIDFLQGDYAASADDNRRALELDPTRPEPWVGRALAREKLGDRVGALADLEHGYELMPADAKERPMIESVLARLRRRS